MKWIRLVLAALVSAGIVVVVGAGPALACSCVGGATKAFVLGADTVVVGTLVATEDPPQRRIMSSTDPITYTVAVDKTFKGDPVGELEFTSAMSGASCGLEGMQVDRRYAFFLSNGDDGLTASLCGGTSAASAELERQIARITGPPVALVDDDSEGGPTAFTRVENDVDAKSAVPDWAVGAAVGGGAVLLLAGVVWWRRQRVRG